MLAVNFMKKLLKKIITKAKYGGRILVDQISEQEVSILETECNKIEGYLVVTVNSHNEIANAIAIRNSGQENIIFMFVIGVRPTSQLTTTCSLVSVSRDCARI